MKQELRKDLLSLLSWSILGKWSGFSFWPGSSQRTQQILAPIVLTTQLGIWTLRDWCWNNPHPTFAFICSSLQKGCVFSGETGKVFFLSNLWAGWKNNSLIFHVSGCSGLRHVVNTGDKDQWEQKFLDQYGAGVPQMARWYRCMGGGCAALREGKGVDEREQWGIAYLFFLVLNTLNSIDYTWMVW